MLISWDYSYYNENGAMSETRTSRQLLEEVLYPVIMHDRIERNPNSDIINELFVAEKREFYGASIGSIITEQPSLEEKSGDEIISTIISIKDGFGFIKDEKINNVFFHYSTLTNKDFDELQVGMKVSYLLEEDPERTKKDEAPRYRAHKVTAIQ
jgi:cold shock CspA family protein